MLGQLPSANMQHHTAQAPPMDAGISRMGEWYWLCFAPEQDLQDKGLPSTAELGLQSACPKPGAVQGTKCRG